MFRKPITIHARSKVSGADRKKLRRAIEAAFCNGGGGGGNGGNDDDDQAASVGAELLLPAKAGELELLRPPAPSRVHIYALRDGDGDGGGAQPLVPVLLDVSGKGDYVPTVQGCWRAPRLLPRVPLKHPLVSRFVVKGADVMLPGIDAASLPSFKAGDVVAIVVPGNDAPVAVGRALLSSREAAERGGAGAGGKAVEIVSFYGDHLWRDHGGATTPNAGFFADVVLPPGGLPPGEDDGAAAAAAAAGVGGAAGEDEAGALADEVAAVGLGDKKEAAAAAAGAAAAAAAGATAAAAAGAGAAGADAAAPAAAAAAPADVDALIEASLLQALSRSVPDSLLPIPGSTLWKEHVLPSRPQGCGAIDVKKSKHKRVPKALAAYAKQGLLSVKEDRASGDVIVTRVDRAHALLRAFVPHATEGGGGADGGADAGAAAAAGAANHNNHPSSAAAAAAAAGLLLGGGGGGALSVEEVFVPGREMRPIFEAEGLDPSAGHPAAEVARCVQSYASRLADADGGRAVVLDATLCDALLKGVLKKGELFPETLPKDALAPAALARCAQHTRVSRGGGGEPLVKKGAAPQLLVSSEKRQGTRRVTKIAGLEQFLVSPEAVADAAAKKFSAATTLEDALGKHNKAKVVCVQGDVVDGAVAWLSAEPFGIPRRFFEVKKCKA
jgi:translation initiation factor 2D